MTFILSLKSLLGLNDKYKVFFPDTEGKDAM